MSCVSLSLSLSTSSLEMFGEFNDPCTITTNYVKKIGEKTYIFNREHASNTIARCVCLRSGKAERAFAEVLQNKAQTRLVSRDWDLALILLAKNDTEKGLPAFKKDNVTIKVHPASRLWLFSLRGCRRERTLPNCSVEHHGLQRTFTSCTPWVFQPLPRVFSFQKGSYFFRAVRERCQPLDRKGTFS